MDITPPAVLLSSRPLLRLGKRVSERSCRCVCRRRVDGCDHLERPAREHTHIGPPTRPSHLPRLRAQPNKMRAARTDAVRVCSTRKTGETFWLLCFSLLNCCSIISSARFCSCARLGHQHGKGRGAHARVHAVQAHTRMEEKRTSAAPIQSLCTSDANSSIWYTAPAIF